MNDKIIVQKINLYQTKWHLNIECLSEERFNKLSKQIRYNDLLFYKKGFYLPESTAYFETKDMSSDELEEYVNKFFSPPKKKFTKEDIEKAFHKGFTNPTSHAIPIELSWVSNPIDKNACIKYVATPTMPAYTTPVTSTISTTYTTNTSPTITGSQVSYAGNPYTVKYDNDYKFFTNGIVYQTTSTK